MRSSSDQTVTKEADKGSSKSNPAKNGSSGYGSGVPGWDIIFKICPKPLLTKFYYNDTASYKYNIFRCLLYREMIKHVKLNNWNQLDFNRGLILSQYNDLLFHMDKRSKYCSCALTLIQSINVIKGQENEK